MRVIPFGLRESLPDNCVNFCITVLLHDVADDPKQRRMTTEHCGVNEGYMARERQTHELTNFEKYSVMTFSAVTCRVMSSRTRSCRLLSAIFPSCWVFKFDTAGGRTLTFPANTNADLGEQKPIRWGSGGCDRGTPWDRIGEKAILPEYTKNKAACQLPGLPLVCWKTAVKDCSVRFP